MKTKITSLVLFLCAAPFANAATVLLFDDFDGNGLGTGDGTSINGGFQLVSNGANGGPGTVGETPSNATISTTTGNFNNTGIVSSTGFDASALISIEATWEISSQSGVSPNNLLGTELLLQSGTAFRNDATPWIRFLITEGGTWDLIANDGSGDVTLHDGPGLNGGVPDGYTVTMNLNAAGWTVTATGFDTNPNASGAWSGGFDFTDLQTTLHAAATIQRDSSGGSVFMNVDSISVIGVPEPSSTALLGLGGLALALRRRRADS